MRQWLSPVIRISIHALRKESDTTPRVLYTYGMHFNPRSP